ncbi:MAG: hypothetical protein LBU04_01770 [Christensenellaceae bacterium]|nr:hypothetical protein [Christensenellaceae bacterium]
MYKLESKRDPILKRPKKVSGAYIGKVTPDGIIPKKKRDNLNLPHFAKEYAASAFLLSLSNDILDLPKISFDEYTAERIFLCALLRLISPSSFSRISIRFDTSCLSTVFPGLVLSEASITGLFDIVGGNREACASFMRGTIGSSPHYLIDGSKIISASDEAVRAVPGYSKTDGFLPQLNRIYIMSVANQDKTPVFYKNMAANIPDVKAFALHLKTPKLKCNAHW